MVTGKLTSVPIGHYEFCKTHKPECRVKSKAIAPFSLTDKTMQLIAQVNLSVNKRIRPETDLAIYNKDEMWAYPTNSGDCEDYVLLKQRILREKGFALANLLITVVRKPDGEGHAVLTIRTKKRRLHPGQFD
jgi:predicted transglutaminase-like cysteine proteinase